MRRNCSHFRRSALTAPQRANTPLPRSPISGLDALFERYAQKPARKAAQSSNRSRRSAENPAQQSFVT